MDTLLEDIITYFYINLKQTLINVNQIDLGQIIVQSRTCKLVKNNSREFWRHGNGIFQLFKPKFVFKYLCVLAAGEGVVGGKGYLQWLVNKFSLGGASLSMACQQFYKARLQS